MRILRSYCRKGDYRAYAEKYGSWNRKQWADEEPEPRLRKAHFLPRTKLASALKSIIEQEQQKPCE